MGDFEFLTKKSSKPVDMLNMRERAIRISRIKQKPELESSLNKSRFGIENKVAKRGKEHEENKEASVSGESARYGRGKVVVNIRVKEWARSASNTINCRHF